VFDAQPENQKSIFGVGTDHWELREQTVLVLHFDVQFIGPQNRFRFSENRREASGEKPVFRIIRYPDLERARGGAANGSAAIDETAICPTYLGNMGMRRNTPAIG
jgi:hypothetical protein